MKIFDIIKGRHSGAYEGDVGEIRQTEKVTGEPKPAKINDHVTDEIQLPHQGRRGITTRLVDPKRANLFPLAQALEWTDEQLAEARSQPVAIAADHNGVALAKELASYLRSVGVEVIDFSPALPEPGAKYDYAAAALPALVALSRSEVGRAILICGNGIGMRDVANDWPGTRVTHAQIAHEIRSGRKAENTNVLALGARQVGTDLEIAHLFTKIFVGTPHEGIPERYQAKVELSHTLAEIARKKGPDVSMDDFLTLTDQYPVLAEAREHDQRARRETQDEREG